MAVTSTGRHPTRWPIWPGKARFTATWCRYGGRECRGRNREAGIRRQGDKESHRQFLISNLNLRSTIYNLQLDTERLMDSLTLVAIALAVLLAVVAVIVIRMRQQDSSFGRMPLSLDEPTSPAPPAIHT